MKYSRTPQYLECTSDQDWVEAASLAEDEVPSRHLHHPLHRVPPAGGQVALAPPEQHRILLLPLAWTVDAVAVATTKLTVIKLLY